MKHIFQFHMLVLMVLTSINPLYAQWVNTGLRRYVQALAVSDTNLFAGTSSGVFYSSNNGASWNAANVGLTNTNIQSLLVSGTNLFAGTDGGVFLSTDNGSNWSASSTGLTNTNVHTLFVSGTNLFAGTDGGVFLSTDNGSNWSASNIGLTFNTVSSFIVSGTNLFVGTGGAMSVGGGVFLSTNNGASWSAVSTGLSNVNILSLLISGTNLFAGTAGGVFLSTDNGSNWISSGLTYDVVYSFVASGENLFAGTCGVSFSTDNGASWGRWNDGFPGWLVMPGHYSLYWSYAIAVIGDYIFVGAGPAGIVRRSLSETSTSVKLHSTNLSKHFTLDQNYPNPFNPTTTISFSLPTKSFVSLIIFDVLGREVSVLLSEELSAGTYSKQWNAVGLASGVYFYRLYTNNFLDTKRLLLLK